MSTLDEFKKKRKQWIDCFSAKDKHAILNQIYDMVWNAAVFQVVNESRRFVPKNSKGHTEANGMLHKFMDRCFFDSQLLAIRRLSDKHPFEGSRGVFSLISLLRDMKKNAHLMTRDNFFEDEGLEYDVEIMRQKQMEYFQKHTKNGAGALWIPKEVDSHSVEQRHSEIDRISGADKDERTPNDQVSIDILEFLEKKVKSASEVIKLHVDKNVAHAASLESREDANSDEISVTLGHLWDSHKVFCQVANFMDIYLLSRASHSFVATPQYDHLEFIDKPLVGAENIGRLSDAWHEFHREIDTWASWGISDLMEEMNVSI